MEHDPRGEMVAEVRKLRGTGKVAEAASIQEAFDRDEYFMGNRPAKVEDRPKQPKKTANKEAWVKYAKKVSDIDPDVLDGLTKKDIIGMLRANGIID